MILVQENVVSELKMIMLLARKQWKSPILIVGLVFQDYNRRGQVLANLKSLGYLTRNVATVCTPKENFSIGTMDFRKPGR